jgi:hypothetical protein
MAWAFSIWWGRHHTLAPLKTGPRDSCNKAPLDFLLAEAVGRTVEGVGARLAEVRQQLLDMEPQLSVAQQAVADARREFLAIDGTAEAAKLREEAESLLARCGTMPKVMRVFDRPGLCWNAAFGVIRNRHKAHYSLGPAIISG